MCHRGLDDFYSTAIYLSYAHQNNNGTPMFSRRLGAVVKALGAKALLVTYKNVVLYLE